MKRFFSFICFFLTISSLFAQDESAELYGIITDKADGVTLIGVNVLISGTSLGAASGIDGDYTIKGISPGEYVIEVSYLGYEKLQYTGITFTAGEKKEMNFELGESALIFEGDIVIIGEKPLVDIDDPKNQTIIDNETIEAAPIRQIQSILNTQTGVVENAEGVHIRGGRTYETGFYIDGVSAQDPLAGTGFGIDVGTNSVSKVEVTTGGQGVEYGDATSGVVNTKTKSGGDKVEFSLNHKRDNFGFNSDWNSVFSQQVFEAGLGGPAFFNKHIFGKLKYFTSLKLNYTDEFTKNPADQVVSSLYPDSFWSPYQDNRLAGMLKLNYELDPRRKLTFNYLKSVTINQNRNMLRITGNDVSFSPGYQFNFHLQPDNANTYTHDTNLQILQWQQTVNNQFSYKVIGSRLFVKLRADANGRPWRPENVDTEFDPNSIVEFPTSYFNPNDEVVFVNPSPGLYNNNGIATLWHDHFVEEYAFRAQATIYSKNTFNKLIIGTEVKRQDLQWIDITRPWIGAPIELASGETSQSFRLGDVSDVWRVQPVKGSLYVSDKIKYRGLVADVGARLEYWMPGKFVDEAINNEASPIRDEIRDAYIDNTVGLGNRRAKLRLLPKVSASFPIRENQMMFFSYGHSTVYPHPRDIYTGLDPQFTDRSTLSRLGNPNLNPEVDISYELGLKSQITSNDALNFTAYWKDKYDFISSSSVLIEDITGREVQRTIRINSDYARVRGLELAYIKRIGKWFNGQISGSYSIASGQSSSSSESLQEILQTGNRVTTVETPLAWDSPLDLKAFAVFKQSTESGLWGKKWLNNFSFYSEAIFRTGRRYTPYYLIGEEANSGRPIYEQESDPTLRYSELADPGFWLNMNLKKWWSLGNWDIAYTFEITNLLNNKNTAIVNPVTGRAYEIGDDVPTEWRDPRFIDPRDPRSNNTPPDNPSRYREQRHFMMGVEIKL